MKIRDLSSDDKRDIVKVAVMKEILEPRETKEKKKINCFKCGRRGHYANHCGYEHRDAFIKSTKEAAIARYGDEIDPIAELQATIEVIQVTNIKEECKISSFLMEAPGRRRWEHACNKR